MWTRGVSERMRSIVSEEVEVIVRSDWVVDSFCWITYLGQ